MKKELQAAERDAGEAELARNAWEEKCWEVDSTIAHKIKDLEALSIDCNQALKRFFSCIVLRHFCLMSLHSYNYNNSSYFECALFGYLCTSRFIQGCVNVNWEPIIKQTFSFNVLLG
jgi:hypothetical protein